MLRLLSLAAGAYVAQAALECPVPPLPYAYEALEPSIGADTMRTHHDKHHASYAKKFCELVNTVESDKNHANLRTIIDQGHEAILKNVQHFPPTMQGPLVAQGGGYLNHKAFWEIMRAPKKDNAPTGRLAAAITHQFGSFDAFKESFTKTSENIFGSGWSWLVSDKLGNLSIVTTSNQDTPIRDNLCVVLLLDVWEHAYYLDYKNLRPDYIKKWWDVVNWDKAEEWYNKCAAGNRDEL